jgi:hypothetical protein
MARWDGTSWAPVGDGSLPNPTPLGVFHGELVVSDFSVPGRLRHWNGSAWLPFGDGIQDGYVSAIATNHDELVAGGVFTFTGYDGIEINNIAAWDGHHWHNLGAGVTGRFFGAVSAMTIYRGKLIVAGGLETAGGQPAHAIASWDGQTCQQLGDGLTHSMGAQVFVNALAVFRGELVATGRFDLAGGWPARSIARWDGHQWRAPGSEGATTLSGWGETLAELDGDPSVNLRR